MSASRDKMKKYQERMEEIRWKVIRQEPLSEGERHWISSLIQAAGAQIQSTLERRRIMPKKKKVGDRTATIGEYNGFWHIFVNELTVDETGQDWNTLIASFRCASHEDALIAMQYIR